MTVKPSHRKWARLALAFSSFLIILPSLEAVGTDTDSDFCDVDVSLHDPRVRPNSMPRAGERAGNFRRDPSSETVEECACACEKAPDCHSVFWHSSRCYLISCASMSACEAIAAQSSAADEGSYYINVRDAGKSSDTDETSPVTSVIYAHSCILNILDECPVNETCRSVGRRRRSGRCECDQGLRRNSRGQCVPATKDDDDATDWLGLFSRGQEGEDGVEKPTTMKVASVSPESLQSNGENKTLDERIASNKTTTTLSTTLAPSTTTLAHLVVSAGDDRVLQLPSNSISISAFTLSETDYRPFDYLWTLLSHPKPSAGMTMGKVEDANKDTIVLKDLIAGAYRLKVVVKGPHAQGSALVNVTVLPPKRINKPPVAIIKPQQQEVKEGNTAILDGSQSTDDDKVTAYKWEEVEGPVETQGVTSEKSMLKLDGLSPGDYKFKLTVTDSDGVANSTFAKVKVIKEADYPPKADAGSDLVITLPQREVVIYGNRSSDDKGIAAYEWSKTSGGHTPDMTGVHSPILHLAQLELGDYTFTLKVTDTAGQSDSASMHVFVKEKLKENIKADAGRPLVVTLPAGSATLDASNSSVNVGKIVSYSWRLVGGKTKDKGGEITIETPNAIKSLVKGLSLGVNVFEVTVTDDKTNSAKATTTITLRKRSNTPPIADAGKSQVIELPDSLVKLDGSKSRDDKEIVSYLWIRDPSSPAAGEVIGTSYKSPILLLSNLVPGKYVFRLNVTDQEGLSDIATTTVVVRPNPHSREVLEIDLQADLASFSEHDKVKLIDVLRLLLRQPEGDIRIVVHHIYQDRHTGRVIFTFHVELWAKEVREMLKGAAVLKELESKMRIRGIFDDFPFPVLKVDTVVCQNNCSGHGTCNLFTKRCACDPFWMENFFKARPSAGGWPDLGESNCDWSVLYVVLVVFASVAVVACLVWTCVCCCCRGGGRRDASRLLTPKRSRHHRYALLENFSGGSGSSGGGVADDPFEMASTKPAKKLQSSSLMISESDLSSEDEEETVFETSKLNGALNRKNYTAVVNGGPIRNGGIKASNA